LDLKPSIRKDWRLRDARSSRGLYARQNQERILRERRSTPIPRRGLGGWKSARGGGRKERRNRQPVKRQIPHGRSDGTVTQNLTGRAITLLATDRPRIPAWPGDGCYACRGLQRNSRQDVMMQHEDEQQVQLHRRQQPCRSCPGRTAFR
jgi:hypothetical protein